MTEPQRLSEEGRRRLAALIRDIQESADDCRVTIGVPCQSEYSWHANTYQGWADKLRELEAMLASEVGVLPQPQIQDQDQNPLTRGGKQAAGNVSSPPQRASGDSSALTGEVIKALKRVLNETVREYDDFHPAVVQAQSVLDRCERESVGGLLPAEPPLVQIAKLVRAYHRDETTLTAAETLLEIAKIVGDAHQGLRGPFTDADLRAAGQDWPLAEPHPELRVFIGWLRADIPELHQVEIQRLAESLDRFLALGSPSSES